LQRITEKGNGMTITSNIANLRLTRGDTKIHQITVKNTDGSVKDISSATVKYTIRVLDFLGTQVLQKTVGAGVTLTTPADGILDATLSAAETAALIPFQRYVYDCEVTISGQVCTVQQGKIDIVGDVSW